MAASVLPGYFDIKPLGAGNKHDVSFAMSPFDSPLMLSPVSPFSPIDDDFTMDLPQHSIAEQSPKPKPKRPSVAERRASQPVGYEFLNFSHPSQAKNEESRRTVRSHVTRQQHQKEQAVAAATAARRASKVATRQERARVTPPLNVNTYMPFSTPTWPTVDLAMASPMSPLALSVSEPDITVTSVPGSPQTQGQTQIPFMQINPYRIYPAEWHSSVSVVIDHYLTTIAGQNNEFGGAAGQKVLHQVWLPFLFSDAMLCNSLMLLSAAHLNMTRGADMLSIDCFTLRSMVINGINEALACPVGIMRDELAAAVLNMAYYEHMFGNVGTYSTHMQGLRRIVEIRGGLDNLGLDGLLERMILWLDSNVSHVDSREHIFPSRLFPTRFGHPFPDPQVFGLRRPSLTQSLN